MGLFFTGNGKLGCLALVSHYFDHLFFAKIFLKYFSYINLKFLFRILFPSSRQLLIRVIIFLNYSLFNFLIQV